MTIWPAEFDDVFDGTRNYVPRAIIRNTMSAEIVRLMQPKVVTGVDGLDEYFAVPAFLDLDDGSSAPFALWRHKGNPADTLAVQLPLDELRFDAVLSAILFELGVPETSIIWRDTSVGFQVTQSAAEYPIVAEPSDDERFSHLQM